MTVLPWAEVIGDPVTQSLSPVIHGHWLFETGVAGAFEGQRVPAGELRDHLRGRTANPEWRGCSVTLPHKETIVPLLDRIDEIARAIGAVNCVYRSDGALVGCNTDVDGAAVALGGTELRGRTATVIGAGGAARTAIAYLGQAGCREVRLLVRNTARAQPLAAHPQLAVAMHRIHNPDQAFAGAAAIINASPLGMTGAPAMTEGLLGAVRRHAAGATAFDMVYRPSATAFLRQAREAGGHAVGGLPMLISQARRAFHLFFGVEAPATDRCLLNWLEQAAGISADDALCEQR